MVGHSPRIHVAILLALVFVAIGPRLDAATTGSSHDLVMTESSSDPVQWEPARLRRAIEDRYRVLPVQDGVMLVPRRENADVKSIEVRGDTIAVNGTVVTGGELRDRVKSDADAILALSYLEPAARRALFEGALPEAAPPRAAEPSTTQPEAAPGETPRPSDTGRRMRQWHNDARVHIGGPVTVAEDETVDGPVVAIGGSVTVNGDVREDVVAVGGDVKLGPKARVRGDVTTVGGTINRDPGAEIDGNASEIGFSLWNLRGLPHRSFWLPAGGFLAFGPWTHLMTSLFRMMLFALLAMLVFLVAHAPITRIERVAAVEPWKAGLVGLLTELLFLPVFILICICLAVSVIGIPLLILFVPAAIGGLFIAFVFGFTGVASGVGQWAHRHFGWTSRSSFAMLLVGLLAIWALTIAGRFVALGGWPIWFLAAALLVTGFLLEYVAWTVGLGAAVMTRFGTRPSTGGAVPVAGTVPSP